jgi:DNA repair protein SbcD/Mre11
MIRMLHFADIHIGMENYGRTDPEIGLSTRVRDFLKRMDEMIEYARQNGVDLVVFAGDAFKNRQPNPTFQREFAWRIREIADLCPIVLLVGNHDLPTTTARASSIEIYDTLKVPNVIVGYEYKLHHVKTRNGLVQVATAPYPIRAGLLDGIHTHGMTISEVDQKLLEQVHLILRDLAREAAESKAPRVLTGHFTVTGSIPGSERNVMVGRDFAIPLGELSDSVWDYVALGHVHKHQNLTEGHRAMPPVVYSGSMERIDFGEEADEKGFCWVELERGATSWRFVPVSARPFVTLYVDVRKSDNPMETVYDAISHRPLEEAVVRMIIQANVETEGKLRDAAIYEALRASHVSMVAAVQKDVERPVRARLGASPEGLTTLELLERFLQSKDTSPERITLLMERAEAFFATDS